jgi:hypothetical protein
MDFSIVVNEGQVLTLFLSPFQRQDSSSIRDQRHKADQSDRPFRAIWSSRKLEIRFFHFFGVCKLAGKNGM